MGMDGDCLHLVVTTSEAHNSQGGGDLGMDILYILYILCISCKQYMHSRHT